MADIEKKHFVQSFVRFLNRQISSGAFEPDIVESLEVAQQCLETAYNLPIEADAGDAAEPNALASIDVWELFRTAAAGNPDQKRLAEEVKNDGNRLMREEKFEEALQMYTRAISMDPTNAVFYCNRAATYSKLGDFQRAASDCRLSLRYEPNYSKAYGRLGIALSKLGKPEEAVDAYKRALDLEPNNQDYKNNLQVAQQQLAEHLAGQSSGGAAPSSGPAGGVPSASRNPLFDNIPPAAAAAAAAAAAGGAFPSMDTIQMVMQQPAVADYVQQVLSDPEGLMNLLNTASATAGPGGLGGLFNQFARGPAGGGGASDGSGSSAPPS